MTEARHSDLGPKVSVVIPAYNAGPFIRATIESVLRQTYTNWHAIIVNNYSTDDTVAIVQSFQDPRIEIVDFANHGVIAAARNRGIALSDGVYIAFLDADDLWHEDKLRRSVEVLESGFDIVSHGEIHFKTGAFEKPVDYGPTLKSVYLNLLCDGNCFSTSAVVCRRDLLGKMRGFDETKNFITAEDYELWLRIMASGAKASILPDMLGYFRIHQDSASSSLLKHYRAVLSVLRYHYRGFLPHKDFGVRWRFWRRLIKFVMLSSAILLKKRQVRGSLLFLREAILKI